MIIRYSNGYQIEGVLLNSSETRLRVAIQDSADVLQLTRFDGTWVTEDCEPVHVDFAWPNEEQPSVTLDDCICSKEYAAKLLHLLFSGDEDAATEAAALSTPTAAPVYHQVV